jgi:hypothetical protein
VVDDDERVLRSYARLLGAHHRIMVAYDGREAIDMIRSGSSPDVLVVELDLEFLHGYRGPVVLKPLHGRDLLAAIDAVVGGSVPASP